MALASITNIQDYPIIADGRQAACTQAMLDKNNMRDIHVYNCGPRNYDSTAAQ